MKHRLRISLIILILAPLLLLGGVGMRLAQRETLALQQQWREQIILRLENWDTMLAELLEDYRQQALPLLQAPKTTWKDQCLKLNTAPRFQQFFLIDLKKDLLFLSQDLAAVNGPSLPPVAASDNGASTETSLKERALYWRFYQDWKRTWEAERSGTNKSPWGWTPSLSETGLRLCYWHKDGDRLYGVELNSIRFRADVISLLPDTPLTEERTKIRHATNLPESIQLFNEHDQSLYQWGRYLPQKQEKALLGLALSPPLQSWRLKYFAPKEALNRATGSLYFAPLSGLIAIALSLLGLGFYFYRESTRELREAAQRVSFVNRVSHELKTPLTNIRLYAELLAEDLESASPGTKKLAVIVAESQRLSRLIGNILSFGRSQRGTLQIHCKPGRIDETVRATLEKLRPSLEAKAIAVELTMEPASERPCCYDPDLVEQILSNLISNVEKYAACGGYLGITLKRQGSAILLRVRDKGPGVPHKEQARIFEEFYRIHNKVNEGLSGAGIGLTIVQELARLHGGSAAVENVPEGAVFSVRLDVPEAEASEECL